MDYKIAEIAQCMWKISFNERA